jgi:SAM-dependent methyltransferase
MSSDPFQLLTSLGLRENHLVLDIGCGTLELGRDLIQYLRPHRYFGVEPQQELIEEGVRFALGHDPFDQKRPEFITRVDFAFYKFGVKFDYMMAHELFPHIGAPLIEACLHSAAASLRPDGLLLASWVPGTTDHEGLGWNPHIQAQYTAGKLRSMAGEAGLEFKVLQDPHPAGHSWAAFFLPGCGNVPAGISPGILSPLTAGHSGYVEQALDIGGHLLVEGWAIDPETGAPADRVLVADSSGSILATIPIYLERPDAAAVVGSQALRCGFRAVIPAGDGVSYYASANNKTYSIAYK